MIARLGVVAAACAVALVGCGGGNGSGGEGAGKRRASVPRSEPLAEAAVRLERAVPGGDCKTLAPLMLHSVPRGVEPGTPPTRADCAYIRRELKDVIQGFKSTKSQDHGAAGFAEGTGDRPRKGEVLGTVWVRDTDGSWKVVFDAVFRPQIGLSPAYGAASARNAERFVAALARRDCGLAWRLMNAHSRFVGNSEGDKDRFCGTLPAQYRNPTTAFAQIRADPGAKPRLLGSTRDVSFHGLELENGRYLVLVMAGRFRGFADAVQRQHENPSVLEFVTVRRPG